MTLHHPTNPTDPADPIDPTDRTMPFIEWVDDDRATGQAAEIYSAWRNANPGRSGMPEILKCFSPQPNLLQAIIDFTYPLHFADGQLTRKQKEMIATFVSGLNQCLY